MESPELRAQFPRLKGAVELGNAILLRYRSFITCCPENERPS